MRRIRVIPVLLLRDNGLYKSERFKKHVYVGDPINAVKIFNDKEVDELVLLDIGATNAGTGPNFSEAEDIASEAFMPVGFGGGIRNLEDVDRLFDCGIEKIVINTAAHRTPELIELAAGKYGEQSIVVSIDTKAGGFLSRKPMVMVAAGTEKTGKDPVAYAKEMVECGAGELVVQSIDREGTWTGYDLDVLGDVAGAVSVPVVALGGARGIDDFRSAVQDAHCAAVAAGNIFVFQGSRESVLISYPSPKELQEELYDKV